MQSTLPLTLEQFKVSTSSNQFNAEKYYPFVLGACKAYGIDTRNRLAAFLSQIGHESANLSRVEENLNYSAQGLMRTWPRRFPTLESAQPYHRNPQMIANKVYANRMSNGNEASGDGWRYRGRGLKQLTGKYNYMLLSKEFGTDFVANPELLIHPVWCAISACWFWSTNNCNSFADAQDIEGLTRRINGGLIGIDDRKARFKIALSALADYEYNA